MKKLLIGLTFITTIAMTGTVAAKAYKLPASYRTTYCYDGGSYWVAQKNAYPEYYGDPATNAYYESAYGLNTMYCPAH